MFNIVDYGRMIQDSARLDAYTEALRRVVTRESVVADIGAGTGIFTVLACRLGARKVYAIEPNETFNVLREVIAENGITDRVECYRAFSSDITLPERASVVISDLRGAMPLHPSEQCTNPAIRVPPLQSLPQSSPVGLRQ